VEIFIENNQPQTSGCLVRNKCFHRTGLNKNGEARSKQRSFDKK